MTTISVISEDELRPIIRKKILQGGLTNMSLNSSEDFSFKFKIQSEDGEIKQALLGNNGASFFDKTFTYNTNMNVDISQIFNYNSAESYNTQQSLSEPDIRTIYDTTPVEYQQILNNSKDGLFSPAALLDLDMQKDYSNIAINERIDNSLIHTNKNYFPFYVNFTFPNTPNNFYNFLKSLDAYELMLEAIGNSNFEPQNYETLNGPIAIETTNLSNVLSNIIKDPKDFNFFHSPAFEHSEVWGSMLDNLDQVLLRSSIDRYTQEHCPDYFQSITGDKTPYIEPIYYEIKKYTAGSTTVLQTFYIPASDSNRYYIDNQVNFGSNYRYEVFAISALFSNNYEYDIKSSSSGVTVGISQSKTVDILKIKIADHTHTVEGMAPTTPEITFLNSSNAEKKIRIYFEPSILKTAGDFIHILDSDAEDQSKAMKDNLGKIKYELGKDFLDFQVFKTTKKPTSYKDLEDSLFAIVAGTDRSSSEVFEMFLTPNMKHYFTFRARNNFNLFSNPTPIYEVELIHDSDETKIISKTVDLKQQEDDRYREFGRFLRIYPAFDQLLLTEFNPNQNNVGDTIIFNNKQYYVGDTEDPIWGKKFKFRIKSKNTGKILDINVDFNLKKEDSEADF